MLDGVYGHPWPLAESTEDRIVQTVHDLGPPSFKRR